MDNSILKPQNSFDEIAYSGSGREAEVGRCKPNDGDVVQEISGEKPMEGVARSSVATEVDSDSVGVSLPSGVGDHRRPRERASSSVGKYVGLRQAQRERDRLKREEARQKAEEDLEDRLKFVKSPVPPRVDTDEDQPVTKEDLEVRACGARICPPRGEHEAHSRGEYSPPPPARGTRSVCEQNVSRRNVGYGRSEGPGQSGVSPDGTSPEARSGPRNKDVNWGYTTPRVGRNCRRPSQPKTKREKGKGTGKKTVPVPPIPTPVAGPSSAPPQTVAGPPRPQRMKRHQGRRGALKTGKEGDGAREKGGAQPQTPPKEKRKKPAPQAQPAPEPRPLPPAPASMETPWVEVVGRNKKKRKPAAAVNTQPRQPARRAEPKLRPPRSAAVVITLTPAAVAKGLSYKQVLTDAQLPSPVSTGKAVVEGCKPNDEDVAKEITGAMPMEVAAEFARPLSLDTDSSESGSTATTGSGAERRREGAGGPAAIYQVAGPPRISDTEEDRPVLKEDLRKCTQVVRNVVRKSGNLKGTSQKALNWVTDKIVKYVEQPESAVIARLEEEIKKWQEHSARLEANMKAMKEENATLKRRLEDLEASANKSSTEEMLAMVEARVQARLESALMGPAQRPTLAHERRTASGDTELPVTSGYVGGAPNTKPAKSKGKRKEKGTAQRAPAPAPLPAPVAGPSSAPPQPVAGPSTAPANTSASTAKKTQDRRRETPKQKPQKGKKNGPPPAQPAPEPRVLPPAPANVDTPWVEVVRRKKKGKPAAAPTNSTQPPKPTRRKEPKLRPPRSAAVVISLTPAAIAKGLTYKSVLTDAQNKVDLTGLEISKMRPKFAATGAPMYEVPGANSEERADSLAARLRECFAGSEDIKISRPTKTVELRLSELDYTATPETVAAALAKA
ncbi:caskin-1-like, partial [Manduca sexta]|uniref:caskin-1-like n=1 Tax=Manduca sexta TaxID=7130 RepID=UPI00188F2C73